MKIKPNWLDALLRDWNECPFQEMSFTEREGMLKFSALPSAIPNMVSHQEVATSDLYFILALSCTQEKVCCKYPREYMDK